MANKDEQALEAKPNQTPKDEQYFKMKFHAKRHSTEPDDVEITVNGESIKCQREVEVVLPARFREAAEHATYPTYSQMPGQDRKKCGEIRVFPFDILGSGNKESYLKMKREGTDKTHNRIRADELSQDAQQANYKDSVG